MGRALNHDFVFLSVDPWQNERWARKQMFAHHLANRGARVVYYTEPRRSERSTPLISRKTENLWVVDVPLTVLGRLYSRIGRWFERAAEFTLRAVLRTLGITNPVFVIYQPQNVRLAERVARHVGRALFCYDFTDDWSEFPGISEHQKSLILADEKHAITSCDVVVAVSTKLYEKAKRSNPRSFYLPNATSFANFHAAMEPGAIADELKSMRGPIMGYVGKITPWRIDFELIRFVAERRPDWSFMMVGPFHPLVHAEVDACRRYPNIAFLGPRNYWSLAPYFRGLTACILPHKVDELTESMDPIKLYDYLASGRPVVATGVREANKYRGIIDVADTREEFLIALDRLMAGGDSDSAQERRLALARANTWDVRVSELLEILDLGTDRRGAAACGLRVESLE